MSEREQEPGLFDLPLTDAVEEAEEGSGREPAGGGSRSRRAAAPPAERSGRSGGSEDEELPLFPVAPSAAPRAAGGAVGAGGGGARRPVPVPPADRPVAASDVAAGPVAVPARGPVPAPFGARLLAALADLGVHLLVAAVGWGGAAVAGVRVGVEELPALGVFLLAFSFLYSVVSLAFWGKTPGMAAAGVVSRGAGGQPLTFGQTGLRWLGGVATALLLGLPLLVALAGRSLPDRLSGSHTVRLR